MSGYVDTTPPAELGSAPSPGPAPHDGPAGGGRPDGGLPDGGRPVGGAGAVHGWVAVWVPGGGWLHVDPGNDALVDERYVVLGWGRDAGEVAPLRGIAYSAVEGARVETAVELERLSDEDLHAEVSA